MASKPERMEESKKWRIAYEKRCSHSVSWLSKKLKELEREWRLSHD